MMIGLGSITSLAAAASAAMTAARATHPSAPGSGYTPVRTLSGWTLPPRLDGGVTELHRVAEPRSRDEAIGNCCLLLAN